MTFSSLITQMSAIVPIALLFELMAFSSSGECDEYQCGNGQCIPDDIKCNKNNPCGDHTECIGLTGWEIFGIVAGCIAGVVLLCCCYACCCCRKSKKSSSDIETTGTVRNNAVIGQVINF